MWRTGRPLPRCRSATAEQIAFVRPLGDVAYHVVCPGRRDTGGSGPGTQYRARRTHVAVGRPVVGSWRWCAKGCGGPLGDTRESLARQETRHERLGATSGKHWAGRPERTLRKRFGVCPVRREGARICRRAGWRCSLLDGAAAREVNQLCGAGLDLRDQTHVG